LALALVGPEDARGALLERINQVRAEAAGAALEIHPVLELIAQHHSEELAAAELVGHDSPVFGIGFTERLRHACAAPTFSAENVARVGEPMAAVAAFLDSPGHRRNLLDPRYQQVGIGLAQRAREWYVTVDFAAGLRAAGPDCPGTPYWLAGLPRRGLPHTSSGIQEYRFPAPAEEIALRRAIELLGLDQPEAAARAARDALERNSAYAYARAILATALLRSNRLAEARIEAEQYRRDRPADPEGMYLVARIAEARGECATAARAAQETLDALPEHHEAWYVLGLARERCGDRSGAHAAYTKLLRLDPRHQGARLGLRRTDGGAQH
jgi:tetratricopeptide (TPR) repeat protein